MRLQVWTTYYWPRVGGTEFFLSQLLPGLRDRGHAVQVITNQAHPPLAETETRDGIEVHRLPMLESLGRRDLAAIRQIQQAIGRATAAFRPDRYFLNNAGPPLFYFEKTHARDPAPTLLTLHSEVPFQVPPDSLAGRTLRLADRIVAVSDHVLQAFAADHPSLAQKAIRLWNSSRLPGRAPTPPMADAPLLALGRLIPEKGFDILLHALRRVRDTGTIPPQLELVGDGPERPRLEALAGDFDFGPAVRFRGYLDERRVVQRIDSASTVIVPSLWQEPFGYVALQAMQRGRAVIASRTGALPELIEDGKTGLLVPPGDPEALAGALLSLLNAPHRAEALGVAARNQAETRFPFQNFLDDYENAFATLDSRLS